MTSPETGSCGSHGFIRSYLAGAAKCRGPTAIRFPRLRGAGGISRPAPPTPILCPPLPSQLLLLDAGVCLSAFKSISLLSCLPCIQGASPCELHAPDSFANGHMVRFGQREGLPDWGAEGGEISPSTCLLWVGGSSGSGQAAPHGFFSCWGPWRWQWFPPTLKGVDTLCYC